MVHTKKRRGQKNRETVADVAAFGPCIVKSLLWRQYKKTVCLESSEVKNQILDQLCATHWSEFDKSEEPAGLQTCF